MVNKNYYSRFPPSLEDSPQELCNYLNKEVKFYRKLAKETRSKYPGRLYLNSPCTHKYVPTTPSKLQKILEVVSNTIGL